MDSPVYPTWYSGIGRTVGSKTIDFQSCDYPTWYSGIGWTVGSKTIGWYIWDSNVQSHLGYTLQWDRTDRL